MSADPRLFPFDQQLGSFVQIRVPYLPGKIPQGLGDVLNAVETALEPGCPVGLLQLAGNIDHRLGADHHVGFGTVHGLHLPVAGITRQGAEHPEAQFIQQRQDMPQFTGDVVFTNQADIVHLKTGTLQRRRQRIGFPGSADILHHGLAGDPVTQVLGTVKTGRVHRHHRGAPTLFRRLADRRHVITDQRRHTGVIDKHRRRLIVVDRLLDGVKQAFLAAPHDHVLLGQVGGHADAEQP